VQSRLAKRLRANGLTDYRSYLALVQSPNGTPEKLRMISALTTNVTHFFRENHHFTHLAQAVLPTLIERARRGGRVRIWSAGCSSGQEPYSIAMLLCELAPDIVNFDVSILATDIDADMISKGREGIYEAAAADSIPKHLLERFFVAQHGRLRIDETLRALVSFRTLNLHGDWPMRGQFDIIFCRNVAIYFDPQMQNALWRRFENSLAPQGWLFVGHSERIGLGHGSKLVSAGITTYHLPEEKMTRGTGEWH